MPASHIVLDQVDLAFDDERSVASAGLLLPATLAERLGGSSRSLRWHDRNVLRVSVSNWSTATFRAERFMPAQ